MMVLPATYFSNYAGDDANRQRNPDHSAVGYRLPKFKPQVEATDSRYPNEGLKVLDATYTQLQELLTSLTMWP
ncbi:hypothetical protein CIB48_g7547 [Xylaria polymorpha]|nr:hypothetical protein CIB48_g7547 [Xylaria polymorpha]